MNQAAASTPQRDQQHGILLMVAGTMIVPIMDAIAKFLGTGMSPLQITWGRFLFQFLLIGGVLLLTLGAQSLKPNRPGLHAIRGCLLAIATLLFFWGVVYLPLTDCIAIFFVQPMVLTLFSSWFLGEYVGWHRRLAVLIGFLGALLVIRPGTESFSSASLLPLGAAIFYAAYMTLTRAHARADHPATMQFSSGLAAAILLSLCLLLAMAWPQSAFAPRQPSTEEWLWLMAIGAIAAIGHLLVIMAMQRAQASVLAPFGYSEIIAATLLGWLVFQDWPDLWTWAGILVIVSCGIYVAHRERSHPG